MLYACVWAHSGLLQQSVYVFRLDVKSLLYNTASSSVQNPAYNAAFYSKLKTQFHNKPSQTRPLRFRVEDDLQNLGFKKKNVLPTTV